MMKLCKYPCGSDVKNYKDFTPEHRNEHTAHRETGYSKADIYEGRIMIPNKNIDSIVPFEVISQKIKEAIIKQYQKR